MQPGGALERLVGKGKAGTRWGEVVMRVAQVRGDKADVMGRMVRVRSGSRQQATGGRGWERADVWDWSMVAWTTGGEVRLGIPHSGSSKKYLECRQL